MAAAFSAFSQKQYIREWRKIDSLTGLRQLQTAEKLITEIYNETRKDKNYPQFVKACIYRTSAVSYKEEAFKLAIADLETSIGQSEFPVKNILHSMAANVYWQYYEQNRWQFRNRTATAEEQSEDIATWDLPRIVAQCMGHYKQSLSQKEQLQKVDLKVYDVILILGDKDSKKLRPTLFDFLAQRAVDFYLSNEASITQPAERFFTNQPEYFSEASRFARLKLTTTDQLSFPFQALTLLQELVAFHLNDVNPAALLDVDLKRLKVVHQKSTLPEKDSLYLGALQKLETTYNADPISTDVTFEIAQYYLEKSANYDPFNKPEFKWEKKKAYELADAAVKRFPKSLGARNCEALMKQIQASELNVECEKAVPIGKPALASISYQNTGHLYFKILATSFDDQEYPDYSTDKEVLKKLNKQKTVAQWEMEMPTDDSFQPMRAEVKIPELKPGYYALLVSENENFQTPDNQKVVVSKFHATNISYLSHQNDQGNYQIIVLDRTEGTPLAGVKVQKFYREYDYNARRDRRIAGETFTSDKDGTLTIPPTNKNNRSQFSLEFTKEADKYSTGSSFYNWGYNYNEQPQRSVSYFTDRAIYRPGQTVYFKGIVLGRLKDSCWVIPNATENLVLRNVNYEEVGKLTVTSNEFGTFSGSFVLPANGLTGQMSIQGSNGSAYFRMEEYKRPKFEITFEPLQDSYKLNEEVTVTGLAKAYAGSAVSEAGVKYRVVRQARYPYWYWWWGVMPDSPSQEITNGEMQTEADGSFKIPFTAIPDPSIGKQYNPVFSYTVYAEVTDLNGETHQSQTSVVVGYQALSVSTNLGTVVDLDKTRELELETVNLAGKHQAAQGTLTIWKLKDPERVLRERLWNRPDKFTMTREAFEASFPNDVYDNEDNVETREREKQVFTVNFNTQTDSIFKLENANKWQPGYYLVEIKTQDRYGEKVEKKEIFTGFSLSQNQVPAKDAFFTDVLTPTVEPGEKAQFAMGSAYHNVYLIYDLLEGKDKVVHKTIPLHSELKLFEIPVIEAYRGGFAVNGVFIKNNRIYNVRHDFEVPFTNKMLDIQIATFRDKLQPGQNEEWHLTIKSKDEKSKRALEAELLAGMYDASLDVFAPNHWSFFPWRKQRIPFSWEANNVFGLAYAQNFQDSFWPAYSNHVYDQLNWFGWYYGRGTVDYDGVMYSRSTIKFTPPVIRKDEEVADFEISAAQTNIKEEASAKLAEAPPSPDDVSTGEKGKGLTGGQDQNVQQPVQIRTNFNETAFFMPQVATNAEGEVVLKFQMPEALTRWKFQGLAHTKDLKIGSIQKTLVTQKDLMLFPNAPRFFRENDTIYFSAKISNISNEEVTVKTQLQFFDALTMQPVSGKLLLENDTKTVSIGKSGNQSVSWKMYIPEGLQAITYRITATSGKFSDGEENAVPVLTNRMLVTESLPLPIRGNQTQDFRFEKLINSSNASSTLRNFRYTLEFTSNPAWYAVQALPYIMEYPYECSEQAFSRFYANSIATHIANSDPRVKQVFDTWRNYQPDALKSNLEKNEELKAVLLEETPWVRQAANESDRKRRIAVLFDLNRMQSEMQSALRKVERNQTSNGGFAWFNGGRDDRYITQHIVAGFGHLQQLGITGKEISLNYNPYNNMIRRAVSYIDARMREEYDEILRQAKKDKQDPTKSDHLSYTAIHYLYARSFFQDQKIEKSNLEAFNYFKTQAATYWMSRNNYLKGMMALALNRYDDPKTAQLIVKSLTETALHSEEMGMYWRNEQRGWWWYQAPIETQALLIEVFNEVTKDTQAVEELKVWLLKQKQTTDWKTTKATSEAIYALLKTGSNLLDSDQLAEITLGNQKVDPYKMDEASRPEAGTGYFKAAWSGGDIKPDMGKIEVKNPNPTVAWGAVYWQYFEQLDKITVAETPVKLSKKLFVKKNSPTGPQLHEVTEKTPIRLGDKVVVRVELRSDRDMEYVHLKDMRASAFEPVNVLSQYKWQDGMGYYEATRDASTNFFISYLRKGTYVFEYELFATQAGEFSNGITSIQCMYAPEFSAHSEGIRVKVVEN